MSAIDTTTPIAEWLLREAERDPSRAFADFAPHRCELCDDPTPPAAWRRHLRDHRAELKAAAAAHERELRRQRRERDRLLRENRELERRSAAHATT